MEKQSLKKAIWILFIAVIFLASYASFGGTGNTTQKTTTTVIPALYPATGTANVIIVGYSQAMGINISCKNSSLSANTISETGSMLSRLSSKGYVSAYYQLNSSYKLETGSFNAANVYAYISGNISSALQCTTFSASANLAIPQTVTLYYSSGTSKQPLTMLVPAMYRNYSIPMNLTGNFSNKANVRIFALFTANATAYSIYNMSIGAS